MQPGDDSETSTRQHMAGMFTAGAAVLQQRARTLQKKPKQAYGNRIADQMPVGNASNATMKNLAQANKVAEKVGPQLLQVAERLVAVIGGDVWSKGKFVDTPFGPGKVRNISCTASGDKEQQLEPQFYVEVRLSFAQLYTPLMSLHKISTYVQTHRPQHQVRGSVDQQPSSTEPDPSPQAQSAAQTAESSPQAPELSPAHEARSRSLRRARATCTLQGPVAFVLRWRNGQVIYRNYCTVAGRTY